MAERTKRAKKSVTKKPSAKSPPAPRAAWNGGVEERRPGTEVWLVAQENAWDFESRGLPPRRGSR